MSDDRESHSATDDLTHGLGLMFRAARKAVKKVDVAKVESKVTEMSHRASERLENVDRTAVEDFGRKAAKHLNPQKLEAFAEEAGREFMSAVNRVAEKLESVVREGDGKTPEPPAPSETPAAEAPVAEASPKASPDEGSPDEASPAEASDEAGDGETNGPSSEKPRARLRVED